MAGSWYSKFAIRRLHWMRYPGLIHISGPVASAPSRAPSRLKLSNQAAECFQKLSAKPKGLIK